jgi:hypothetical protein
MDTHEWVKKTDLSSPITERAVLLVGRDGILPTKAIGSGVFVADRLIMTARHVVQGYWDIYNNPKVRMDLPGKKMADFEMFAVQAPGNSSEPALWAASKVAVCPYSDLALISVVPVDELAKGQPPLMLLSELFVAAFQSYLSYQGSAKTVYFQLVLPLRGLMSRPP